MIAALANELYEKSMALKRYSTFDLMQKGKRTALLIELQNDQQIAFLILKELKNDLSFSSEYYELALFMCNSLFECVFALALKKKN